MDTVATTQKIPGRAWAVVFVTYLAGFTAPANMAKMTALAPVVMEKFGIQPDILGYVIAIFSILGVILAFPAVSLIKKYGIRVTVVVSVATAALGSVMGALTNDLIVFMASRFFEGAGMGIMGVAGATAITPWFPKDKRGLPLGIWGLWVSTAMVICPLVYGWIVDPVAGMGMDLHVVWWGTFVFDLIVMAIFLLVYREPSNPYDDAEVNETFGSSGTKHKATDIFKSKALIGLGLIFLFDEMSFMTINGFMSTYLVGVVGVTLVMANVFNTLYAVTGACFAPLSGALSDFFKTRKWIMLAGFAAGVVFAAIVFTATEEWVYWPLAIVAGMAGSMGPSLIWVAAPETVPGDLVPAANGWLSFTQNLGMVIGSLILGNLVTGFGWTFATFTMLVPLFIICIIIFFITCMKIR